MFFFIFLLIIVFSNTAKSDTKCIGEVSCSLIDESAKNSGLSLQNILGEIEQNIVNPIKISANSAQADDFTRILFTSSKDINNFKISLGSSGILGTNKIHSKILNYPFDYTQYPGSFIPQLILEKENYIFNFGFKAGSPDFGTKIFNDISGNQFLLKTALGEKFIIFKNDKFIAAILAGGSYTYSNTDITISPGTKINIMTQYGRIGWSGLEFYSHRLQTVGGTFLFIGDARWKNFTLGFDAGLTQAYMWGRNTLSKYGTVGPFLGSSGFFNVGVESSSKENLFFLIPRLNVNTSWEFAQDWYFSLSYGPPLMDSFNKGCIVISNDWK